MIKVLFFDVGETLVHGAPPPQAQPGAIEALECIFQLTTEAGEALQTAIISNYLMPSAPVSEAKIRDLEEQYRTTVLAPAGLLELFEPFDSRVTLSSRAGIAKPAREIFTTALSRLNASTVLSECLFVTEELDHLIQARQYGMLPVRFGAPVPGMRSFLRWDEAPLLIAELVAPHDMNNLALSAAPALSARYGISEFKPTKLAGHILHGTASQLLQLNDPRLGALSGVYVERPTTIEVKLAPQGPEVHAESPDPEEIADTVNFVQTLIRGGKIAQGGPSVGTTHVVEPDHLGRMRLIRKRYSR